MRLYCRLQNAFNLDYSKILYFDKELNLHFTEHGSYEGLTLSQTTNFRLSKTERVCRRQFEI